MIDAEEQLLPRLWWSRLRVRDNPHYTAGDATSSVSFISIKLQTDLRMIVFGYFYSVINSAVKRWFHIFCVRLRGGARYVSHLHFLQFESDWLSEDFEPRQALWLPSD